MFVKNNVTLAVVKYFFAAGSIQWLSDIFAGLLLQLTNISHGERLSGGGGILRGDSSWSGWDDIFLSLFVYGRRQAEKPVHLSNYFQG